MTAKRKRRRRRTLWSFTAGEPPHTVCVHERRPGGTLYERVWDPAVRRQRRRSLGHRDRHRAQVYAVAAARRLAEGAKALQPAPTVGSLLAYYLAHRTPQKGRSPERRRAAAAEDSRRGAMWLSVLGGDTRVATLGLREWQSFAALRRSGAIDARGPRVRPDDRRPVGERAVDADLMFLVSVFNWACGWRVQGEALLDRNPWAAPAPGVKRSLERPRERSPRRPVATWDRYLALREAAERVLMEARRGEPGATLVTTGTKRHGATRKVGPKSRYMKRSYLPEILELAEQTGRRVSAVCRLWYSDVAGLDAIRWRPIKDEDESVVPTSAATRATLQRILQQRPGAGDRPIFPAPRDPARPISRRLATEWLEAAERLAGVSHLQGGSWHPYRRKWSTERKHLPDADVMVAGGWRDARSLKESYQQADSETVLAVVNEPRKLGEPTGWA